MTAMSGSTHEPPPNPPPLPPSRINLLQRITAPFSLGARAHGSHSIQSSSVSPRDASIGRTYKQLFSLSTVHRTGIPILALDNNKERTHVVLAGQEILKTVRVHDGKAVEDFNLRSDVNSYASTHGPRSDASNQRREYLPAKDVRWSHGSTFEAIVATAALNGRISLYDVNRINGSRVELARLHEHTGQVNKLDFDPFGGYYLLSGSQDKTVRIWDIRAPKAVLKRENIHVRHPVRDVKWSPTDVGEFALCTENGIVQRWDWRYPQQALLSINAHEKACYSLDWHPDGRHLVSGGFDKYIRVWDAKSDNRKLKPLFQLRAPQAVMNIRWRPPCWVSDRSETGHWQSTQLAASYTDDDPRVHVWDLRRPALPLNEIDRFGSRPTDLLWASEDFLWTVGYEGMFVQTDIRYTPSVQDSVSPCTVDVLPDGSFMAFVEDTRSRADSIEGDQPRKLTGLPYERLSGATDDGLSRSLSDEDVEEDTLASTPRRTRRKTAPSRSTKSQGNTPPAVDGFPPVTSLDQSMVARDNMFSHDQVGTFSRIEGAAAEPHIVKLLAENYAQPCTAEDREKNPNDILARLENALLHNAEVCDYASLHRMAQSWRILCAVIVAELKTWAEHNRKQRLEVQAKMAASATAESASAQGHASPSAASSNRPSDTKRGQRPQKVITNLFKGVAAFEFLGPDIESTSNMTTPLAMPLPDSPHAKVDEEHYVSLSEIIEPIPPLPPSVINSHSTAAAASKALLDDDQSENNSAQTSPEKLRPPLYHQHKNSTPDVSAKHGTYTRPAMAGDSSPLVHTSSPRGSLTQEDRRAAIRNYRAQARPLFTLDTPVRSPRPPAVSQHGSADSFPMFSASTESSKKDESFIESLESSNGQGGPRHDSEDWQHVQPRESFESTPPSGDSGGPQREPSSHYHDFEHGKDAVDFAVDDTPGFSFGTDGQTANKPPSKQKGSSSAHVWSLKDLGPSEKREESTTVSSSASDTLFHFEQVQAAPKHKIYNSNPIRRMTSKTERTAPPSLTEQDLIKQGSGCDSTTFVHSDFRPIDFTSYEPKMPWAWSALPLICHTIAFDMQEGVACAQFSVHLLMHVHPFFFNQAFREPLVSPLPPPSIAAERLMRPDLSHRIIEGLFLTHMNLLKKMKLFGPMAELKNLCIEHDYPAIYRAGQVDQPTGGSLQQDPYILQIVCTQCSMLLPHGRTICQNCRQASGMCPICHMTKPTAPRAGTGKLVGRSQLWTYCQACGHGAHLACMEEWIMHVDSEGECPTLSCGCDCGPGARRQQRIAHQVFEAANNEMIRGSRGGAPITKRDPIRAVPSPAVDKTRDTLRYADLRERATQSGDEMTLRNISGRGPQGGSNLSRSGSRATRDSLGSRRVRLVTPGEQNNGRERSS